MSDDLFVFADNEETVETTTLNDRAPWVILIVDDEEEVHKISKLVLGNLTFEDRRVELLTALSASEAKTILESRDDIAVALIDVVMETDTAGLDLVKTIRDEYGNHYTRLILRTGQPGQAPEEDVIKNYDINDYKAKTELTSIKLKTVIYAALRSYRDINSIEKHRSGLQKVLKAIANTSSETNLKGLTSQLLAQIAVVLELEEDAMYCSVLTTPAEKDDEFEVLAKTGSQFSELELNEKCLLPDKIQGYFKQALSERHSIEDGDHYIGYLEAADGEYRNLLYISKSGPLSEINKHLLEIFIDNFSKAYASLALKDEIEKSQRELVYILGEAVEVRSKETGSHVRRVGEISYILGKAYGLNSRDSELLKLASPLHDVGKVGIPDSILNKPGAFEPEERAIMETHAEIGYSMLKNSSTETLQAAAKISMEHHEHWDGNGYPQGLSGQDINVMARIAGLADVFDALGSKRCYKEPWPMSKILDIIDSSKGKQFEPKLVELLHEHIDEITALREKYPDSY